MLKKTLLFYGFTMDNNVRSSVSRIKFESDDIQLPRGIKIEPDIDDEATLQYYPENDNARDLIQSTAPKETIEISDDEGPSDKNPQGVPSHETPQSSRPLQESSRRFRPSQRSRRQLRVLQKSSQPRAYRLSQPKAYPVPVRVIYQNTETQTEIQMVDAATCTDDFESYSATNVKNKQVIEKKTIENDGSKERTIINNISDRNIENNNEQNIANGSNNKEIVKENSTDTEIPKIDSTVKIRPESNAKKSIPKKMYFRCKICSYYYAHRIGLIKHFEFHHNKKNVDFDPLVPFKPECKFCQFNADNIDHYNKHIRSKHKQIYNKSRKLTTKPDNRSVTKVNTAESTSNTKTKVNKTPKIKLKTVISKNFIPKSVLFKCSKCSIHFLNCKIAMNHAIKCEKGVDDDNKIIVSCKNCQRNFYTQLIRNHYYQHEHTDVFATHVVYDGIVNKLLFKCSSCEICFNDNKFMSHRKMCSNTYRKTHCTKCNLKIAEECISDHMQRHELFNSVKGNFVVVDILE